jgi:hypothetical protein
MFTLKSAPHGERADSNGTKRVLDPLSVLHEAGMGSLIITIPIQVVNDTMWPWVFIEASGIFV